MLLISRGRGFLASLCECVEREPPGFDNPYDKRIAKGHLPNREGLTSSSFDLEESLGLLAALEEFRAEAS